MRHLVVESQAGQISAELLRRGVAQDAIVYAVVDVVAPDVPMAAIAKAGGGFDWLDQEPELYSDDDLVKPAG